ncbi:hypothetical protein [Brevibacillus sp. SAFN-007a]|uniref:hypothetical protein n=1 Tax=Brevibacillus sp. SAFN-007a TaxID=3436862 RepID=UPI003F8099E5
MDIKLMARLAFEKDEEYYQKLATQRALLKAEKILTSFNFHQDDGNLKKKIIKACKAYEIEKIIGRLKHRETIRTLYPKDMKVDCLKRWPV